MKRESCLLLGCFLMMFAALPAHGSLIIDTTDIFTQGGVSSVGSPGFAIIGGGGSPGDPYKLAGGGTFQSNGTAGSVTLQATGSIQLLEDEQFFASWEFTTELTGGTAQWHIGYQLDLPLPFGTVAFGTPSWTIPLGTETIDGSVGFTNPTGISTPVIPFVVEFIIDWTGAAGDIFSIIVPENSIDYSVQIIPEPTALSLLALGGLALVRQKRK